MWRSLRELLSGLWTCILPGSQTQVWVLQSSLQWLFSGQVLESHGSATSQPSLTRIFKPWAMFTLATLVDVSPIRTPWGRTIIGKEKKTLNTHTCTHTYLYAANKSFADMVVCCRQAANIKSLKFQSRQIIANLHWLLFKLHNNSYSKLGQSIDCLLNAMQLTVPGTCRSPATQQPCIWCLFLL